MSTTSQTSTTTQVYRVYIKATPEAIWEAITNPDWTEKYMYASRVDYDLRPGGAYRGYPSDEMRRGASERGFGIPDVVVDGEVIEAEPPRRLVQTWRLLMDPALEAEGFTRLTWEIEDSSAGVSKLDGDPRRRGRRDRRAGRWRAREDGGRRRLERGPQRPEDADRDRSAAPHQLRPDANGEAKEAPHNAGPPLLHLSSWSCG
jgi:uncharacterized protein YndB with AHSA1/START domain